MKKGIGIPHDEFSEMHQSSKSSVDKRLAKKSKLTDFLHKIYVVGIHVLLFNFPLFKLFVVFVRFLRGLEIESRDIFHVR